MLISFLAMLSSPMSCVLTRSRFQSLNKSFCALAATPPRPRSESPEALRQVSLITDARKASQAVQALLNLPKGTPIAWSTQTVKISNSSPILSLCAYAGDSCHHGTYYYVCPSETCRSSVWRIFRRYFEDQCNKTVCIDAVDFEAQLRTTRIRLRGALHDVTSMARLNGINCTHLDQYSSQILNAHLHKRRESLFFSIERPWQIPLPKYGVLEEEWILAACADAHAVYHIYKVLNSNMLKRQSSSMYSNNLFESYENFYALVERKLSDMNGSRSCVDSKGMEYMNAQKQKDIQEQQEIFQSWALQFFNDAESVDMTPSMLRHLLFAPYKNIHDNSRVPEERKFCAPIRKLCGKTELPKRGKASQKRNAIIRGARLTPQKFTSNGVPSVSKEALQKLSASLETTEESSEKKAAQGAITAYLKKQDLVAESKKLTKMVNEKVDAEGNVIPMTEIDFDRGVLTSNLPEQMQRMVRSEKDHELVVLRFDHLKLCVLAELSECEKLKKRLRYKDGVHGYLAKEFSSEVSNAVHEGTCVLSGEGRTVQEGYPEKFNMARLLDRCMTKGDRVEIVKSVMKCSTTHAWRLMDGWFGLHPAVRRWCEKTREGMATRGVAESVFGRQRTMPRTRSGKRLATAASEGVTFAIESSGGDFVMQALMKIVDSERVRALSWKALFADKNVIVLQGPSWSADEAPRAIWETLVSSHDAYPSLDIALGHVKLFRGENLQKLTLLASRASSGCSR